MSWVPDGQAEWGPRAEPPVCPPGPASGFGTCFAQTGDEGPELASTLWWKLSWGDSTPHQNCYGEAKSASIYYLVEIGEWTHGFGAGHQGDCEPVNFQNLPKYDCGWIHDQNPEVPWVELWDKAVPPSVCPLQWREGGTRKLRSLLRAGRGKPFSQEVWTEMKSRQYGEGLSSSSS